MQDDDRLHDRVLSALNPDHGAELPARWQQRKSALTRQKIVDAAVDCLVAHGYAGLTTAAVAQRCAISRGTMSHHFATRIDLVQTVVESVFYDQMRAFLDSYRATLAAMGEDFLIEIATEKHWLSVQSREYAAYIELALAARTDAELAPCFTAAAKRYDDVWSTEMRGAFPQWQRHWDALQLANDFAIAAHMGLLLNRPVLDDGERMARVRALIVKVVAQLYAGP